MPNAVNRVSVQRDDPGNRQQQQDAQDDRDREPETARGRLLLLRQVLRDDRDEDDVVDPEHDLEHHQSGEADPRIRVSQKFQHWDAMSEPAGRERREHQEKRLTGRNDPDGRARP